MYVCKRAYVRLQAAGCSQLCRLLSSDDHNHQRGVAMSITVTMSAILSHTADVTQTKCRIQSPFTVVEVDLSVGDDHRCSVAVECPTDLFVASRWLERSSSRFSVTLLVFIRADHSTLQVITTFYVVFISTFIEGLLQEPSSSPDLLWLVHRRDVKRRG